MTDLASPVQVRRPGVYTPEGYRAGGRWERILRAASRPLTQSEILQAVDTGRHSRNVEKVKIHKALLAMRRQGLIARLDDPRSFITTAHGVRMLDADRQQPSRPEPSA